MTYLPAVAPKSRAKLEREAEDLLRRCYPEFLQRPGRFPAVRFFHDLEDHGLDPAVELLSAGVEGITWPDGRVVLSEDTYRGACRGDGRCRFTVVHEGCHGLFHRSQLRHALVHTGTLVLHRKEDLVAYRNPEWQANAFASAVLMPKAMVLEVIAQCGPYNKIKRIMEVFQVSRQAAEVRLRVIGIN